VIKTREVPHVYKWKATQIALAAIPSIKRFRNRANSVRAYLIAQGINPTSITAVGYGKSNPIASKDTPEGRQQNRRVEIIISGQIIGTQIGSNDAPNPR